MRGGPSCPVLQQDTGGEEAAVGNTSSSNTVPRALDTRVSRLSGCDTCVRIFVHDHGASASLPNCNRSNQRFTAEHPLHAQLSAVVRSQPSHGSCPPQHLPATAERHGSSLREQFRILSLAAVFFLHLEWYCRAEKRTRNTRLPPRARTVKPYRVPLYTATATAV